MDEDHPPPADGDGDERLLEELRGVVRQVEPVPHHVTAAAQAALGWRTLDDDLAELLYDSSEHEVLAGVRAQEQPRLLSFRAGVTGVDVEISGSGPDRTMTGQILPPGPARVLVRHEAGVIEVESDARGRFVARGVPTGTVSLRLHASGSADGSGPGRARPLATPWLPI